MLMNKRRCLRVRRTSDSSHSEDERSDCPNPIAESVSDSNVAEAVRELQKVRKRPAGISIVSLSRGKVKQAEITVVNDPFKLRTGGLVDVKQRTGVRPTTDEDDVEARLAKTFASETNKRDEDAEMIKYIEEELARRKGFRKSASPEPAAGSDLLRDVPEHLRPVIGQQKEDMLSNQMLCGIPEVDLGVEAKMKNIEATEDAKQSLMKQRFAHRLAPTTDLLAPTNVAVNFVQHSRWNNNVCAGNPADVDLERDLQTLESKPEQSKTISDSPDPIRIEAERERLRNERATDSIALQRFKTYMRDRKRR